MHHDRNNVFEKNGKYISTSVCYKKTPKLANIGNVSFVSLIVQSVQGQINEEHFMDVQLTFWQHFPIFSPRIHTLASALRLTNSLGASFREKNPACRAVPSTIFHLGSNNVNIPLSRAYGIINYVGVKYFKS